MSTISISLDGSSPFEDALGRAKATGQHVKDGVVRAFSRRQQATLHSPPSLQQFEDFVSKTVENIALELDQSDRTRELTEVIMDASSVPEVSDQVSMLTAEVQELLAKPGLQKQLGDIRLQAGALISEGATPEELQQIVSKAQHRGTLVATLDPITAGIIGGAIGGAIAGALSKPKPKPPPPPPPRR